MKRGLKLVLMALLVVGALGLAGCITYTPSTSTLTADIKVVNNTGIWVDVYLDGVFEGYVEARHSGYINYVYLGAHDLVANHNGLSWGPRYFTLTSDGYTWTITN